MLVLSYGKKAKLRFITIRIYDVANHYIFHPEKSCSTYVSLYDHLLYGEEWEKWENLSIFVG